VKGNLTYKDRKKLFDLTKQLHDNLYSGYTEFGEVKMILDLSRIEEIDKMCDLKDALENERNELQNELEVQKRRVEAVEQEKQEKQEALRLAARRIRELEEQLARSPQ
jgi:cell fate (sporulation/competence/biofilm development) regulator YmcA (YheA/YmcA/DUF963 family)